MIFLGLNGLRPLCAESITGMAGFGVEVNLSRNFLHQVGQFSIADNNKVVKNNPGKFLEGYILELSKATKMNWWKIYTSS